MRKTILWLLGLSFATTVFADYYQSIEVGGYWQPDSAGLIIADSKDKITLSNTVVFLSHEPLTATATAVPERGWKVAAWYLPTKGYWNWAGGETTDAGNLIAGEVNPLELSYQSGASLAVLYPAVEFDWIYYNLAYNGNGGSTHVGITDLTYNEAFSLAVPTKQGWTCAGWRDGSNVVHLPGASVSGSSFSELNAVHEDDYTVTLTAQWTANTYTVRFNGNGATSGSTADVSCTYDSPATLTKNGFAKTGNDFVDWNTKVDGSGTHYADQASVQNLTSTHGAIVELYAQWRVRQHQVTVSVDPTTSGWGSVSPSGTSTFAEGSQLQISASPCSGYVFKQWKDGSTENPRTVTVTGPATYQAVFAKKTYTIHFEAHGGCGTMEDVQATCHEDFVLPANAFSNGLYPFKSWNTRQDGHGTTYWNEGTVNLSDSNGLTLYAQWDMTGYTLRIYPCGGILAGESQPVEYREKYPLIPQSTNLNQIGICTSTNGAPFKGYYSDRNGSGTQVYDANGNWVSGNAYWTADGKYNKSSDLSVYAFWGPAPGNVEVAFAAQPAEAGVIKVDYDHRQVISNDFVLTVIEGSNFVMTASVTNKGYSFCCWTNTLGGVTNANPWTYGAPTVVTNIAVFTGNVYKVSFEWWDEEIEGSIIPKSRSYTFGSPFGELPTATPYDRSLEFVGWYDQDENEVTVESVMRMSEKKNNYLYAKVQKRTAYTVDYVCEQSHAGAMTNETFFCNEETALTSNAFRRTGYTFQGWAKSDDKSKVVYADGERVLNLVSATETATLFAVWSNNVYTVKFDKNGGGVGQMDPQTFTYDCAQALPSCGYAPPTGLDFLGWSNAVDNVMYADEQVVSNLCTQAGDETTLYAIWGVNVGEYSLAMGCRNLKWEPGGVAEPADWVIVQGGVKSEKPKTAYHLAATIRTSGKLSFRWSSSQGNERVYICLLKQDENGQWIELVYDNEFTDLEDNENLLYRSPTTFGSGETNLVIALPPAQDSLKIGFCVFSPNPDSITKSHVLIESVTWEPDAAHPEPTDADKATISSVTVSGGKFSLSFLSDVRFDYNLRTNANLQINNWGVMTNAVGTGETITFDPPILDGQPQLFYKVETIQRQD